jgi:PAS domain S-box-containing protein
MHPLSDAQAIKRLESLLTVEREERARLQKELDLRNCALDSAKTHFVIVDVCKARWEIVYANRAIAQDHGYEAFELLGRSPAALVPVEANPVAFERIGDAVRGGNTVSAEVVVRRKDGTTFWVGVFMAPILNAAGSVTHYIGIGADITARLAQERAQRELQDQLYREMQERERMSIELRLAQKLESVGRLAAGIAHEINTPIQYIGDSVSFLQSAQFDLERLLERYRAAVQQRGAEDSSAAIEEIEKDFDLEFLAEETPRAFQRTLEGVERVAGIVRAMKEFAHPDHPEHRSADLNHAIETTLTVAQNEYKYSAQIETHLGNLPQVTCNVGELNQVFLNLIVNAAHAIAESGKDAAEGRITIATSASGDQVVISIADNGCGIPDNNLQKVFDPFFTTKPVGRGTGQGLAIARSIVVEKHGGAIDVHSALGSGTQFILRLPVQGRTAARAA